VASELAHSGARRPWEYISWTHPGKQGIEKTERNDSLNRCSRSSRTHHPRCKLKTMPAEKMGPKFCSVFTNSGKSRQNPQKRRGHCMTT